MKTKGLVVLCSLYLSTPSLVAGPQASPEKKTTGDAAKAESWTKEQAVQILKIAEEIRSPNMAVIRADLKTTGDQKSSLYDMRILRSTEQRAYLEFLSPPEEVGRRMLAKGRRYWSTFPDSKRVVAISKKEMIGNSVFALADMFQIDAEADYEPLIDGSETMDGRDTLRLELRAKHDDAPYARITYWVEKGTSFPIKAKFYGVSGKHLKTLMVESRNQLAGRLRPDVTKMTDETIQGHISWWKTKTMVQEEVSEHVFSKEFLSSKI